MDPTERWRRVWPSRIAPTSRRSLFLLVVNLRSAQVRIVRYADRAPLVPLEYLRMLGCFTEQGEVLCPHREAVEIAALETSDNGKPTTQARGFDLEAAAGLFQLIASVIGAPPSAAAQNGPLLDVTTLEPYAVIGGILPFNWPPIHTAAKIAPALAVGNGVVLKPPEQAPLSVLRMAEIVLEFFPTMSCMSCPAGVRSARAWQATRS